MPGFFQPAIETSGIKPFDDFPMEFSEGTLSGVVSTDELASVLFVHYLVAGCPDDKKVYAVAPGRLVSPKTLSLLGVDPSKLLIGSVYSPDELLSALELVEEGSLLIVGNFPALNPSSETVLEMRRVVDDKGLIAVLHHFPVAFNELDHPGEFTRLFKLPEILDALLILRINSYRGHYRLNMTVSKAPPEWVSSLGDHSIPIDGLVKPLLGKS
ncbi:hypothetical protein [Thermococcus stetteri]|uniref:hypothetical protein n=1 Tax=Thermococcus stetteri TaxID=49900 RepID=UPI001AEA845D|nr:hypothetical protein [Thermococcus stetteri]MBP1912960.1 hypothetical protein [Thermococcus stetteri]